MERYQLAKIIEWTGTFRSRKRMQKLVFMLQAAGCPLDADYDLHHYGPYSQDVALLTGQMVGQRLLEEAKEARPYGEQYSYTLLEDARRQVSAYEASPRGSGPAGEMARFRDLALELYQADLKELEVASTIVFFRKRGFDWETAVEKTREFKNLPVDPSFLGRCRALASKVVA
jgi:uncharacterized protein